LKKANKKGSPSVGQKIRNARQSTGLTLEDVGQQIGISAQALSAIERGSANPSKQTLISLARVLENDFGELWLNSYEAGPRKLTNSQPLSKTLEERESPRPLDSYSWDELILQWAMEAQEAANLPQPVKLFNQKSARMPIHYEIIDGNIFTSYEGDDKVGVPYSLIPSIEDARCIRIKGCPIRDAFICPGDILVLREVSIPEEGKVVLALVDKKIVIRRWELTGRKVKLIAFDHDYEPLIVPRRKVEFVGELMGVLRIVQVVSGPFYFK
jgi:SOS-response transcriptional repressor LexA